MARAMHTRWRWPPETLVPPWAIELSKPSGFASMKSLDWAIRAASSTRSSGMPASA